MSSITVTNTIPPPSGTQVEEAVRAAIGDLPGEWSATLTADDGVGEYQIRVRGNGGPTWKWVFADIYEQKPDVIRDRISNGLRGRIPETVRQRRHEILEAARRHGGDRKSVV